jgi:hypothetical protein
LYFTPTITKKRMAAVGETNGMINKIKSKDIRSIGKRSG